MMDASNVLLVMGQIAGTALRLTVQEADAADRNPHLTAENRAICRATAKYRRSLEALLREGRG